MLKVTIFLCCTSHSAHPAGGLSPTVSLARPMLSCCPVKMHAAHPHLSLSHNQRRCPPSRPVANAAQGLGYSWPGGCPVPTMLCQPMLWEMKNANFLTPYPRFPKFLWLKPFLGHNGTILKILTLLFHPFLTYKWTYIQTHEQNYMYIDVDCVRRICWHGSNGICVSLDHMQWTLWTPW